MRACDDDESHERKNRGTGRKTRDREEKFLARACQTDKQRNKQKNMMGELAPQPRASRSCWFKRQDNLYCDKSMVIQESISEMLVPAVVGAAR